MYIRASQVMPVVKNTPSNAADIRDEGSVPGFGRSPGGGHWQPTPVFLPGESHGQRSLAGYSLWGYKNIRHDWRELAQHRYIYIVILALLKYWNIIALQCFCCSTSSTSCVCVLVIQSCLTFRNPMDYSPPGSFVHGIFQARILEQVAIAYSRGSSWPRDQICISCISCRGRQILYHWATWITWP